MTDAVTAFDIQRVPAGLQNVLNLFGPGTPPRLAQELAGTFDLLQFYGLNQRQVLAVSNGALAAATAQDLVLTPGTQWGLLYSIGASIPSAAALTQVAFGFSLQRGSSGVFAPLYVDRSPYAVYPAAQVVRSAYMLPYPLLLPPLTTLRGFLDLLVGVANSAYTLSAEVGLFG